jgi:transposase
MESYTADYFWVIAITKLSHNVRIMRSKFVILYCQNEKNKSKDAEAVCETAMLPYPIIVSIKI